MKKFFYCFCILGAFCMMMSGLTSCKDCQKEPAQQRVDTLLFQFTLTCSEEFINFIIPTATYIDANGVEQNVEISNSSFVLATNNDGLIYQSNPVLYTWTQKIVIPNMRTGQRDMRITYKKRNDAPNIDSEKTYVMYHQLSSGYTIILKEGGKTSNFNNVTVTLDGIDPYRKDIKGENLPAYLEDIKNDSDYAKLIVK